MKLVKLVKLFLNFSNWLPSFYSRYRWDASWTITDFKQYRRYIDLNFWIFNKFNLKKNFLNKGEKYSCLRFNDY
jgi:hypothetical protein